MPLAGSLWKLVRLPGDVGESEEYEDKQSWRWRQPSQESDGQLFATTGYKYLFTSEIN